LANSKLYTVELKLKSFELPKPEVRYTKENGVIAVDTNASPIHLAIAEVSKTGELLSYQTIIHHSLGLSQNSKDTKKSDLSGATTFFIINLIQKSQGSVTLRRLPLCVI
jgi:hypothetical protein